MKFSPIVLLLLLVFDGLEGLILPQERPDKGPNTTLLANFSGLYVRRDPCNNKKMESSSYEASHEFHHYNRGGNWTDYTNKCSTLITNFLKSICNLMKFNNKLDGSFTFHVNTSISQKNADQDNCKNKKHSLPTIIIEATNDVNSDQERKGLTGEELKKEVAKDGFKKQKSSQNLEKTFRELSEISQSSRYSTQREKAETDRLAMETSEGPVENFESTQSIEQSTNTNDFEQIQEGGIAPVQVPSKYVTERAGRTAINSKEAIVSQTDAIDRLTVESTEKPNSGFGSQIRNSKLKIKPAKPTNQEKFPVNQPRLPSNVARKESSEFILPDSLVTQQPTIPLYSLAPQLPEDGDPYIILTTASPTNTVEKQETVKEITEFSEKSESMNAGNAPQIFPNVQTVQPAESLDYLEEQAEYNTPKIGDSTTDLPERFSTSDRFEQEIQAPLLPTERLQKPKQSDALPYAPLASEVSSGTSTVDLGPQTNVDATQPQPENSFGQSFEYPVSEEINQASSYSQRETHQTSSEELTELNRDSQYYTTFAPRSVNPRYGGRHRGTPSTFPVDELSGQKANVRAFGFSSQKPSNSKIDKKTGNVYDTQPGRNPAYTSQVFNSYQKTTPLSPAESLNKSNQKALAAAQNGEEVIDQFQSSKESDSTYSQISETTLDSNQHIPGRPVYGKMENIPLRKQLRSKTLLDRRNTQPLDYLPTTSLPVPINSDERAIENAAFKAGSQVADFSEQTKSPKSFKNRLPVPEPSRNVVSSLEEVETTESSLNQASEVKANFYPSRTSNYGNSAPTQKGRFVSESTLAPDTDQHDLSDSLSTTARSFLPEPTVSGFRNRKISSDRGNNLNDGKSPTIFSGSKREMTTTSYESDTSYASEQNQQLDALSTDIYETQATSTPRPVDLIIPVEIQSNEESRFTSSPKTTLPDYEANYGKNFDSFTTYRPTTLPLEPQSDAETRDVSPKPTKSSANQFPVDPLPLILSPQDLLPVGAAEISEKINPSPKSEPSYLKFQQPLRTSTNIPRRNQFPAVTQPHSRTTEQFTETTSDFSDAYSQQTSSIVVPPSASQEFSTNTADSDRQDASLTVDSQSEDASASEESYHLNENEADTFSEQREYDDIVSSQDARTQIPQPQPSFDYSDHSGQLSSNERESDTALTDLQTSKTFEGSEKKVQSLLTYSPSPSAISNTETFTTETYESDEAADEYPLSSPLDPKPVASALEGTETSSAAFTQSSDRNVEATDATELSEDYSASAYDSEFIPVTPPPSLTVLEEPPFIKTKPTYAVPKTSVQDISTAPRPQSTNSVKYDQEIITIDSQPTPSPSPAPRLPVNYSGQFPNKKNDQGFVGSSLAVTQQTEDRLERPDDEMTVSQAVVNSNWDLRNQRLIQESTSNEEVEASSTAFIQKKYDAPPLLNKGADSFSKTETDPNNFALATSTVRPVHTKTTIDEEVITTDDSNSLVVSSTQAPPGGYFQKLSNEQFDGQRRNFPNPSIPQPSRQFHPENRPTYHPPQGFPPYHQFDTRPYGNHPQPMDFNPQVPRPWPNNYDNFAREHHNRFPPNFQHNQFGSHFSNSGRFQPGLDTQRDRFMFSGQPPHHGNGYFPDGRPNFSYNPDARPGPNPESFPPSSQVPPNPHSFQERDSQYQSYKSEGRLGERNFNSPQYSQNYELHPHYPRNDFNERFGSYHQSFGPESRDRFHPDQIPYNRMNQMMPPYGGHPSGNFNQQEGPHFLNNSNQQVEAMYQQHNFDHRANFMKEAKTEEAQKINTNQASPEVLADYKKALTGLASGERLVEFDQEVITISPEKGPSSETTLVTEEYEQRQDATSYDSRNRGRQNAGSLLNFNNTSASGQTLERSVPREQAQQGNPALHPQNHPLPFSHPVDPFGPQRPPSQPNFSNQFRSASSDFRQQSNANSAGPQKPNGGNEAASNPQQFALGPDQVFPSRKPDPASSRRSNVPSPVRNPVASPIAGRDTFSSG